MNQAAFSAPTSVLPRPLHLALVDEEPTSRRLARYWLEHAGYEVTEIASLREALSLLEQAPELVLLELGFSQGAGLELLRRLHVAAPRLPVIVLGTQRDAETAVSVMRAGAFDYVVKPLDSDRLLHSVSQAQTHRELELRVQLQGPESAGHALSGVLAGKSSAIRELSRHVARVLEKDVTVSLFGENGSGQELLARAIHEGSPRAHAPFVCLDCSAVDPHEHESLLFGRESREAQVQPGAFEQANGGVLFLENIEALAPAAQAGLTQALAQRRVRRLDGTEQVVVNVRLIVSSRSDLRALVQAAQFREDLYFRLVVYPIEVPSLKDRTADIPLLVGYYLRELGAQMGGSSARHLAPEALEALCRYAWPGNLRQLENVVHRSLLSATGDLVSFADLPAEIRAERDQKSLVNLELPALQFPANEVVPLRELEKRAIEHALKVTGGSVTLAAKKLGIGRATLYRRIASLESGQEFDVA